MGVLTGVLAAVLAVTAILLAAATVTHRAAAERISTATRKLRAEPEGGLVADTRIPGGLGGALDRLEAGVDEALARRRQVARDEDRLSWALGAIASGVVIFNEQGEVAYRNDPAASFLAGRHSDALVEGAITALARDALRGRAGERELELFGPPRRMLHVRAVPLADANRPSGVLVVVEDTSERRRLEIVRRDFVANISHELKTPVGALALLAETLSDEGDLEVARRLAERMAKEALRVGRTIDDLLELSQIEIGPSQESEPVAVAEFVGAGVDRVRRAAEQRDIEVVVDEAAAPLAVVGDRRQLVSAVSNLVSNAVKYSEPGTSIAIAAHSDGTWVDVVVRDHGIGIPQHDLGRIFERFYRVDQARSRDTGGTGLGLAIVRHIASNHRGEVRVESREGVGSTFTLRLPAGAHPAPSSKEIR